MSGALDDDLLARLQIGRETAVPAQDVLLVDLELTCDRLQRIATLDRVAGQLRTLGGFDAGRGGALSAVVSENLVTPSTG